MLLAQPRPRRDQWRKRHPAAYTHAVEQMHQVFSGDVAERARRERAAAEATYARVENRHTQLQRSVSVGVGGVARVVEMHAQRHMGSALSTIALVHLVAGGDHQPDVLQARCGSRS